MSELTRKLDHLAHGATSSPAWVRSEIAECAKLARSLSESRTELLAACRAFLGGPEMPQAGEPGHIDFAGAVKLMRAAVAKAEDQP